MTRHDLHQHLWPETLIAGLIRRRTSPRMRCDAAGRWTVELPGEPVHDVNLRAHDPARRTELAERDGLDVVAVCLSSPLGIEALPASEAAPLLGAYNVGIVELGAPFALWGAISLVYGSDRPVVEPVDMGVLGAAVEHALLERNPQQALGRVAVAA